MVQKTECCSFFAEYQWCVMLVCPWLCNMQFGHLTFHIDKTIKLWKVFDKQIRVVAENNHTDGYGSVTGPSQPPLRLPRMTTHDSITAAVPRKVYANAHAYHINSISVNSDGETYISADDLRINLWNMDISDQSFSKSKLGRGERYNLKLCRHCRHKARQHGGAHRGHYCGRVSPNTLQSFHVLKLEGHH